MPLVCRLLTTSSTSFIGFADVRLLSQLIASYATPSYPRIPWRGWHTHNVQTYRSLFELHPERKAREAPADLPAGNTTSLPSRKNESWHATSEALIDALGKIGKEYARPQKYARKIDLSHTTAYAAAHNPERARQEAAAARVAHVASFAEEQMDLKGIFVGYLIHVDPFLRCCTTWQYKRSVRRRLDAALLRLWGSWKWLNIYGWDVTDLMNWSWILTAQHSDEAAIRLTKISKLSSKGLEWGHAVPITIYLFLLRRQRFSARGLQHLMFHAWNLMGVASQALPEIGIDVLSIKESAANDDLHKKMVPSPRESRGGIDEDIFIMIVIRLLRHARCVWPAACESIITMFCHYLNGYNFHTESPQDPARLSFVYNSILKLLVMPTSNEPFISTTYQQRAQFAILRRMNQFDPPLVVDRTGYRAVTQMQLMHKKTERERDWAALKSKSWPPWKEDKLGTDAAIGPERGVSRAKEVLNRAEEAGYSAGRWESAASLLAGWDTDGSPTIQSRRVFAAASDDYQGGRGEVRIWANRIRATRTLNEAWALFQGQKDEFGSIAAIVYEAMLEKLMYDQKRKDRNARRKSTMAETSGILPGDGFEVYPEPIPLEAVYVRTKAPSVDEFFNMMINDGIGIDGKLLAKLLIHAPSLSFGIKALMASPIHLRYKAALLGEPMDIAVSTQFEDSLQAVSPMIFDAFVPFLTRFIPKSFTDEDNELSFDIPTTFVLSSDILSNPLHHAFRIMRLRKPKERSAWNHMIGALSQSHAVIDNTPGKSRGNQLSQDILSWHAILRLLAFMDDLYVGLDLESFMRICTGYEKALIAAERLLTLESSHSIGHELFSMAKAVLLEGLCTIKDLFKDIIHPDPLLPEAQLSIIDDCSGDQEIEDQSTTHTDMPIDKDLISDTAASIDLDIADIDEDPTIDTAWTIDIETPMDSPPSVDEDMPHKVSPSALLPTLLHTPRPAHLHAYIRVLGLRRDYSGLLSLLEWISTHYTLLYPLVIELRNGKRMFRRCLIAFRVFLERSWTYYKIPDREKHVLLERREGENVEAATREIWLACRQVVEEQGDGWGGWPRDEEVEEYVVNGRFV